MVIMNKSLFCAALLCVCFLFSCDTGTGGSNVPPLSNDFLQKLIYANTNVEVDTIAEQTNLTEFVYDGDSIVLENLFVPLLADYEENGKGEYKKVLDTPQLRYNNKRWTLPLNWQTERLMIEVVFSMKTKNRRYIGMILTDPTIDGSISRNTEVGIVDIDSGDAFCYINDYPASPASFLDNDNDGIVEYNYLYKLEGNITTGKRYYSLCYLTANGKPEFFNGEPNFEMMDSDFEARDSIAAKKVIEELIKSSQE